MNEERIEDRDSPEEMNREMGMAAQSFEQQRDMDQKGEGEAMLRKKRKLPERWFQLNKHSLRVLPER